MAYIESDGLNHYTKAIAKELYKIAEHLAVIANELKVLNRRDEAGCDSCSDKAVSKVRFLDGGPNPHRETQQERFGK